jgi:hypothetical protein
MVDVEIRVLGFMKVFTLEQISMLILIMGQFAENN